MATRKKKAPAKRKKRRWLIPKIVLLLGCMVLIAFIGAIFLMEHELRRIGLFGSESAPGRAPVQAPSTVVPRSTTAKQPSTQSSPSAAEELSREEKKQLDDILRARSGE